MACIVDANKSKLRCDECGREVPIPLGTIPWVTGVLELFDKAHKSCGKGPNPDSAYYQEPRQLPLIEMVHRSMRSQRISLDLEIYLETEPDPDPKTFKALFLGFVDSLLHPD